MKEAMLSTVISLASLICCRAEASCRLGCPFWTNSLAVEATGALEVTVGLANSEALPTCSGLGNIPLGGGCCALAGASRGLVDENKLPLVKGVCAEAKMG